MFSLAIKKVIITMNNDINKIDLSKKGVYFVALGGVGEIGMNLYAYCCDGKWIIVDIGIGFAGEYIPSIELIMPDISFLEERKDDILGIIITHSHEDHYGAIGRLWSKLKCPIYATQFTSELINSRLDESSLLGRVDVNIVNQGDGVFLDPFEIEFMGITHSIPQSCSLAIRTKYGNILHSGDWKFDETPLVGNPTDYDAFKTLAKEGVMALVCDSTNANVDSETGSEAEVRENLARLFKQYKKKIAVACFASNVARVESIALAAKNCGRSVALIGRSLWKIEGAARACGYLEDVDFITEEQANMMADDSVLYICTGSQGEPRASLNRISKDEHKNVYLGKGDVVFFSSKPIPGNEKSIIRVQNNLANLGVKIVTHKDEKIHVSGHPGRKELTKMYQMIKPKISVPVHGEDIHLVAHKELAESLGVTQVADIRNGDLILLKPEGKFERVAEVHVGVMALDGNRLVSLASEYMKNRKRIAFNTSAVMTLVMDGKGKIIGTPQVSALDVTDEKSDPGLMSEVIFAVCDEIEELSVVERTNDDKVKEVARIALRNAFNERIGVRPIATVHLVRV